MKYFVWKGLAWRIGSFLELMVQHLTYGESSRFLSSASVYNWRKIFWVCWIFFQSETLTIGSDVSHLLQLWTTFVNLPTTTLSETVVTFRKSTLVQLNQILQLQVPTHDTSFYRNILIPCLNFEATVLETDKVGIFATYRKLSPNWVPSIMILSPKSPSLCTEAEKLSATIKKLAWAYN